MQRTLLIQGAPAALTLKARTAAELMTPQALSINADATLREAAAFLTGQRISAALVTEDSGEPVGVLSRADLVRHDSHHGPDTHAVTESLEQPDLHRDELLGGRCRGRDEDDTPVRDVMTQVVFSVAPDTSVSTVVEAMLSLGVHRLFVVDGERAVGVVSALDVLRNLCQQGEPALTGSAPP